MNAALIRATNTNDADATPDVRCISLRFQSANTPAMSKNQRQPYGTNRSEEEDLTWLFASSPAVYNKGVDTVRGNNKFYMRMRYADGGSHYVWQKAQTAMLHYTRGPAD